MSAQIHFQGPHRYRLRSAAELSQAIVEVSARRAVKGPRLPTWNWYLEVATEVVRRQTLAAFRMADVIEARRYLDSVVIRSSELSAVNIVPVVKEKFNGSWFAQKDSSLAKIDPSKNDDLNKPDPPLTLLYFHGGGYSFSPRAYATFIAQITLAAKAQTFALDYRLSPEHRFPAQLDDALRSYRWLLETGIDSGRLIVAGDSAGAHLALTLLLAARDAKLPLPALAIALSPPPDFEAEFIETEVSGHPAFDWIDKHELEKWAAWFCGTDERQNPLISPIRADLRGLPPIYIQAGCAEILYPSIQAFADRAQKQGANVTLEAWDDMTHVFQMFGPDCPQSAAALHRIAEVIAAQVRQTHVETVSP